MELVDYCLFLQVLIIYFSWYILFKFDYWDLNILSLLIILFYLYLLWEAPVGNALTGALTTCKTGSCVSTLSLSSCHIALIVPGTSGDFIIVFVITYVMSVKENVYDEGLSTVSRSRHFLNGKELRCLWTPNLFPWSKFSTPSRNYTGNYTNRWNNWI